MIHHQTAPDLAFADEPSAPAQEQLLGESLAMRRLRDLIRRVAPSDRPVLVTGPTGAGKELTVRAIHEQGPHADEPLFDINCGALSATLIESQLFGHERGAFTGADRKQEGHFAAVGRGTLFLDEIAELPIDLQAKLLRVLETGTFRPLGSNRAHHFRGRVVAATHAAIPELVARGRFREDLYYRLNVLEIRVPSLEQRPDDIPLLVVHFLARQRRPLRLTGEALDLMRAAPWPGNVRQLRSAVERLAVFASRAEVSPEEVRALLADIDRRPTAAAAGSAVGELVRAVLAMPDADKLTIVEQAMVAEALRLSHGNKTAAARLLGVHRKAVERRTDPACDRA